MVLIAASLAIDLARSRAASTETANAADAATLAAASRLVAGELSEKDAEQFAITFFLADVGQHSTVSEKSLNAASIAAKATVIEEAGSRTAEVQLVIDGEMIPTFPVGPLTDNMMSYGAESVSVSTTETHSPISMALVLDQSGSMAWCDDGNIIREILCRYRRTPARMAALKASVTLMNADLIAADPESRFIRLGAVSYSSGIVQTQSPGWGVATVTAFVNGLNANGGTNATAAVDWAAENLTLHSETSAHIGKGNGAPVRIMVFMTDGEADPASSHNTTLKACERARGKGVEIYTVAFSAGPRGRELLRECATGQSHYYEAQDAADLSAAFQEIGAKASARAVRLTR